MAQLDRLEDFIRIRKANFKFLSDRLKSCEDFLILPEPTESSDPSWFGFPIIVGNNAMFSTSELRNYLESNGIETRPIVCGNITLQPAIKMYKHRIYGQLKNASYVMKNGIAIACHQSLSNEGLSHIINTISNFMQKYS